MTTIIRSYNMQSRGALELQTAGARLVGGRNNNLGMRRLGTQEAIFNWGSRQPMPSRICDDDTLVYNDPISVEVYANKGNLCNFLAGAPAVAEFFVPMTSDKSVAQGWLDSGSAVVNRALLNASNGRGITISDPQRPDPDNETFGNLPADELPDVPLYTKYIKKAGEYRIHAGLNSTGDPTIICAQRKGQRRDAEYVDTRIRNAHDTGAGQWVFLHQEVSELPLAVTTCIYNFIAAAFESDVYLDYAGYDVIYNRHYDRAWIVEANTAPGIGPQDAMHYMNFFRELQDLDQVPVPPRAVVSAELDPEEVTSRASEGLDSELYEEILATLPDDAHVEVVPSEPTTTPSEGRLGTAFVTGETGDFANYTNTSLTSASLGADVSQMDLETLANNLRAVAELRRRLTIRVAAITRREAVLVRESTPTVEEVIEDNDGEVM